jgi:tryptophan-rich sensory protein
MFLGVGSAACAVTFNPINKTASLLLLPYIAWLGLATSINYYLYQNNSKKD